MSKISKEKKDRLKEEILHSLYENYPKMMWTFEIGDILIRDDEFILKLLMELKKKRLVMNYEESKGKKVKRKWGMKKEVYEQYKQLLEN